MPEKCPQFYVIISRKIFFPIFLEGGGARAPALPRLLRLWSFYVDLNCRKICCHFYHSFIILCQAIPTF